MRSIAGALASLLLAGCLRADVNRCDNGAICQAEQKCTEQPISPDPLDQHPLCGVPALVDACHGLGRQQFDSCDFSTSLKGTCHWGICDPCDDDLAGCHNDGWIGMTSHVTGDLTSVWVASVSEAYAVGYDGVAVQYDGYSWQHIEKLEALAGVGTLTPIKLKSIWGVTDPTELFVLSADNRVFHFAGGSWTALTVPSQFSMAMLGGFDRTNVFAAGLNGEIWRFDGGAWSESAPFASAPIFCSSPSAFPQASTHLWGAGPSDVYLACHSSDEATGYVRHYDGSSWTTVHTAGGAYYGVWGSASNNVYVVGRLSNSQLTVAHYDGSGWSDALLKDPNGIGFGGVTVWGTSPSDVYVGGESGIFHFDGSAWKPMTQAIVVSLAGSSADNVLAVGPAGSIMRHAPN
jgi:hypothetical protein